MDHYTPVRDGVWIRRFDFFLDSRVQLMGSFSAAFLSHGIEVVLEDCSISIYQY